MSTIKSSAENLTLNAISFGYIHCKPDGTPFYVGKGIARRANSTGNRNIHYNNTVAKYGKDNILKGKIPCSSEKIAFALEEGIIKCFKRMGVKLTNMTNGGDGGFGIGVAPWNKGKSGHLSDEVIKKMSDAKKGKVGNRLGSTNSPEAIAKMAASKKGKLPWIAGRKHTAETKLKMRETKQRTREARLCQL